MAPFEFSAPPLLSRATYDRGSLLRSDTDALRAGWSDAQVLEIDPRGRFSGPRLQWKPAAAVAPTPPPEAVFLGVVDGTHRWALPVPTVAEPVRDLRSASDLEPNELGLFTAAVAVLNWHAAAGFSPQTGARTTPSGAGWLRTAEDGRDEFPRTDPAIITVVHDGADHALLGRSANWPEGVYSTFAGFVEPGESLEQCVIREIYEEAGVVVRNPRYLGSQPWPFPRSLMLGFEAVADRDAPLQYLDGEIAEARWFSRAEIAAALTRDVDWSVPVQPGEIRIPGSISIARSLIEAWAAGSNRRSLTGLVWPSPR